MAKILANRLSLVLENLISPNQTAFLGGRRICDNVSLAQEFILDFNNKFMSRARESTNLKKAFDTIHWDSINKMMEMLGFDNTIWELVIVCVKSSSFSELIEARHQESGDMSYELYAIGDAKVESHLAFANDFIFYSRASTKSFETTKILQEFIDFGRAWCFCKMRGALLMIHVFK